MSDSRLVRFVAVAVAFAALFGCSSDAAKSEVDGSSPASGGAIGTGGAGPSSGGAIGTGGAGPSSGGAIGTGGVAPSSGGSPTTGTGGSPTGSPGSEVSFDGTRIRARIIPRRVSPGAEKHVCVVVELPNPERVWVDEIHATLTAGSHHLIVDRRPAGTAAQTEPEVCGATMGGDNSRLIIAQQAETNLILPEGVAFAIEARQPLFLQLHYFNAGDEARDITGEVEFVLAGTTTTPIEARSVFTGTTSINLPPRSPGASESFYAPPPATGARHVFALTSHTHKLGVRSTIERVATEDAAPTTPVHESLNWSEPPLDQFAPPLVFDGSDGLRLKCNYNNTTNSQVGFGTGVDQEMCFMWVYYFDQ
jgi:hypothetical protein